MSVPYNVIYPILNIIWQNVVTVLQHSIITHTIWVSNRAQERSRGVFSFEDPLGGAALEEPYPGGYMTGCVWVPGRRNAEEGAWIRGTNGITRAAPSKITVFYFIKMKWNKPDGWRRLLVAKSALFDAPGKFLFQSWHGARVGKRYNDD